MLTILGRADRSRSVCDGVSRRGFLQVGGMALGGLTLAELLRLQAEAAVGSSHKAVINVYLPGGPPHQDMWDIKTDAPAEIRGEFAPIGTSVPGIDICEMFPRIAARMERFVPIRSVVGAAGGHDSFQCMTGRSPRGRSPAGGWPSMGAAVSKLQGATTPSIPPHLTLCYKTGHQPWGDPGDGGFLGMAHAPFRLVGGQGTKDNTQKAERSARNMVLEGVTLQRLRDRRQLMSAMDRFRRRTDASGAMDGVDAFTRQAMGILTSSELADALDISGEDPQTLERYGSNDPIFQVGGAPKMTENFLIARRLVEAGARVVSLNFSRWDWHGKPYGNFKRAREDMPLLDMAVTALVDDLVDRGLDRDVSVVVWGEFGRTPKINNKGGRDHWPRVSCALLAGGGMRTGQVIGSTNRLGEHAVDRPVTFGEIFATLYHNLGIDVNHATVRDLNGRPQYLVESGTQPLPELV
jgi:hypothetical protein